MSWRRPISLTLGGSLIIISGVLYTTPYSNIERKYIMPLVHLLDAETAHKCAVWAAKNSLVFPDRSDKRSELMTEVFGCKFDNPIGLAAGFDKNGEALPGLDRIGFGFVEIGSVTPIPQPGNPKPRVFRLPKDKGVINRYGFNSHGLDCVAKRLQNYRSSSAGTIQNPVGVNLGINKSTISPANDYRLGVKMLGHFADYIVINISSPNTPGLRSLQATEPLRLILNEVNSERRKQSISASLLLKISPDLIDDDLKSILDVVVDEDYWVSGVIVSNTTISRPHSLISELASEKGGLSGEPLKHISTELIRKVYQYTEGKIAIVGVGGIDCGQDAYDKIRAGASLVQIYTSLVYSGSSVVPKIKTELCELLIRDGFSCVSDAVGADFSEP